MLEKPESEFILKKLISDLSPQLYYHAPAHTLDVYDRADYMAKEENISESDTKLLLVAAMYHDSGYLVQRENHESISSAIAAEYLPAFGYSNADVEKICAMINATKLPQQPKSKPEEIICDADLDYLGRDDFFELGDKLFEELLAAGAVTNKQEWDRQQIEFLQGHTYFTKTAQQLRNQKKEENLNLLLSKSVS